VNHKLASLFILIVFILSGCASNQMIDTKDEKEVPVEIIESPETTEKVEEPEQEQIVEINYNEIKPYEVGHIMVIMYHGIQDLPPYHRTKEDFLKDLQYLYDHNYRLISMSDYKNGHISIPAGYKPVVLTFDDGLSTTFALEEREGKLVVKEDTAIALIEAFCEAHPDFGKAAALYINGGTAAFDGAGTYEERLNWLVDHGYEIGNHTNSHPKLNQLNSEQVQEEIGKVDQLIKDTIENYTVDVITYPHGIRPEEAYRNLVVDGIYEGNAYHYDLGFREGPSGPMVASFHKAFDAFNCPRVRGSEGEEGDLWWWLEYYESHPELQYVSDGNPNRIAVPKDKVDNVNMDKLNLSGLELYTW
jgi:hypothetical protein